MTNTAPLATIKDVLDRIAMPLSPDSIRKRQGPGGKTLDYLDGADVACALNDAFTPLGWTRTIDALRVEVEQGEKIGKDGKPIVDRRTGEVVPTFTAVASAQVTLRLHPFGVVLSSHSDVGHHTAESLPSKGQAIEFAEKSAVTDAMKRAAHLIGPRMGLALYLRKDEREDRGFVGEAEDQASLAVDFSGAADQRAPAPDAAGPGPKAEPGPLDRDPLVMRARWMLEQKLDPAIREAIAKGDRPGAVSSPLLEGRLPPDPAMPEVASLKPLSDGAIADLMSWPAKDALTRPLLVEVHEAAAEAIGTDEVKGLWQELGVELRKGAQVSGYQARLFVAAAGAVAKGRTTGQES